MMLVESIQLKKSKELSELCHQCKDLYNLGNFYVRQDYFHYSYIDCCGYLSFYDLDSKFMLKPTEAYKKLSSQVAQNVLKMLINNWKAYYSAKKDWKKNPIKYQRKPNPPKYLRKNGEFIACFNHQHTKIKNGKIYFPKKTKLEPIEVVTTQDISQQIRIVPKNDVYILEMIYSSNKHEVQFDYNRMIAIDLGINNLACVVNNIRLQPFAINGKPLKSTNHYFNKEVALLQSKTSNVMRDKCKKNYTGKIYKKDGKETQNFIDYVNRMAKNDLQHTSKMKKLRRIRHNRIKDYMHKASRYIINFCIENNIGNIIIGKNLLWKNKVNLGKRINQNFVQIPFNMLIDKIQYKADLIGINVKIITEEYTSKCSFLDNELIKKHNKYKGKRISRGLFKSSNGTIINADVNAGYNIMKKAFRKAINADGIKGAQLHPLLINLNSKTRLISINTS